MTATARYSFAPGDASRLALALVADADVARDLAAELLARHAAAVEALESATMYARARRDYEDGWPIVIYELDDTTRRCAVLIAALRVIAAARKERSAA